MTDSELHQVELQMMELKTRFEAALTLMEVVSDRLDAHNQKHDGVNLCTTDLDKRVGILELKMGGIQWVVGALVLATLSMIAAAFWQSIAPYIRP